jgi:hypothetical protein
MTWLLLSMTFIPTATARGLVPLTTIAEEKKRDRSCPSDDAKHKCCLG